MPISVIFLYVCSQYKCTQNHFTLQVYTKPVYSTGVQKYSLHYSCIQNQFIVHVYTKLDKRTLSKFCVKGLSHVEKLEAQKYSFNMIYKY